MSRISLLLYFVLACVSTWPLLASLKSRLPLGTESCRTVPLFNLWTLEWNVQCVERGKFYWSNGYWDAPIFFPVQDSFAMSEAQPIVAMLAPLVWLTGSSVLAYNIYVLVSLTLNGWFTNRLLRNQGISASVALLGGGGMVLLPMVHWQLGVSQLIPVWGVIWGWDILLRWGQIEAGEPRESIRMGVREGLELSAAWVCTFAMSVHHGLFASVLFILGLACLVLWQVRNKEAVQRIGSACLVNAIVAGLLIGPMLWRHHMVGKIHGFEREADLVDQLSVWPSQYAFTYGYSFSNWILGKGWAPQVNWPIGAGGLSTVLALVAMIVCFFRKANRFAIFFLLVLGAVSFLFSLGNHLSLGNWSPWGGLVGYVPGFSQVRSAYRFAYFVQMAIVLLSAIGIDTLVKAGRKTIRWMAMAFGLLSMLDPWPGVTRLGVAPAIEELRSGWVSSLKNEPRSGVLILPLHEGGAVRDYEVVTEWMLQSLQAGMPLVNGYSGFFPEEQLSLARRIGGEGLSERVVAELSDLGIGYVVISPYSDTLAETAGLNPLGAQTGQDKWQVFKVEKRLEGH
ncbi:hypothetical protein SH449x_004377 [Pirellulaceae bacterium SH449]